MKKDNTYLFEEMPVSRSVISLVVPTVISQMITVIYNVADTYFIGSLNDPDQVAAASVALPVFVLLTSIANLFGIGGASLMARCMGAGDRDKASRAASFAVWTGAATAFAYGLLILLCRSFLLPAIGANGGTFAYCYKYVFWAVTVGAVPTVASTVLSHLVRAEGYSGQASAGMALGGILNIVLDPLFITVFGLEIEGAAIATMLSNAASLIFFLIVLFRRRESSVAIPVLGNYTIDEHIPREVMLVGLPSCFMMLMGVASNIVVNTLMASYCNEAVAGIGIAKKVDLLAYAIATGMSQGVLPLIAYNYSARNYMRMRRSVIITFLYSLTVSALGTVFLFTCAGPIVRAFIDDPLTVEYGSLFQRIMCTTSICISVTMIIITLFQAVGEKTKPTVLSMLRKGLLDIPAMYIMNAVSGVEGIAWAVPIADVGAMTAAVLFFIPFWKRLKEEELLVQT